MAYKFNPFTDTLDIVGSGGGSYIDGEVEYHSNLPVTVGTPAVNSAFLVRKGEGLYFISRKPAGIWVRELNNGNLDDWKFAGLFSDLYRDANFRILNNADVSKELAFDVSGLATGTTSTLTVPASGTIARTSDFAAPPAIGNTTRNTGAFTTLNATSTITGALGAAVGSTSAAAIAVGHANSGIYVSSNQIIFTKQGVECMFFDNSARVNVNTTGGLQIVQTDAPIIFSRAISLFPDATNGALAQRSGTQAQEYRVYATHTSSTNYQRMTVKSVRQTLSALSGASATTTGTFIPDGAVVVGVTTRVATLLTGATGYTIGDGTDADRWGDVTGTAIGTTSDNRDWTAGTIECFTAGGNVTLTAKTSNFTAGAVEICVFYLAGEAD